ncbi:MAG: glucosamine-6-phosphate deaminase [Acidimicrobiia bacterium]|nr:MAG: glucosamine-6-phosphate deaminase [Acidimicrobiia bacterium]
MSDLTVRVFEDGTKLGQYLADRILDTIADAASDGTSFVLGCPGGRSLRTTYLALGESAHHRDDVDLSPLIIVMMDEYVTPSSDGFEYVPIDAHFSCRRFAYEEILGPLAGLRGAPGVERVWVPHPDDPAAHDERIASVGGIDHFLLASGESDGHVAFNPPGSDMFSATRVVELAETTRHDNLDTFPAFEGLHEVPTHGVTIGLGSIVELSLTATLVCTGSAKRRTVNRVRASSDFDPAWPATIVHRCRGAEMLVDRSASGDGKSIKSDK